MSYTNRIFTWDFDSLKRFYEHYIVKWLNSAMDWTEEQKAQARENLGIAGDGAFDVSAKTGDSYSTLSDALTAVDSLLSASNKKGGMSIKYVQSPDNKYVQYRFLLQYENTTAGNNAFLNTSNWQGVDDTPTVWSDNLVKSGGVVDYVDDLYLDKCPYLNKDSVISSTDDIKSFRELTSALLDIKIINLTKFDFETYNYGVYKINNDPSSTDFQFYVGIRKYPKNEVPTQSNMSGHGSFESETKPQNGWITIKVAGVDAAKVNMNWDALESQFHRQSIDGGVGLGVRFNQDYLKGDVYDLDKAKEDIDALNDGIEEINDELEGNVEKRLTILEDVVGLVDIYHRSDFYNRYTDLSNKTVGDTITLPLNDIPANGSTGYHLTIAVHEGDTVVVSNYNTSTPKFNSMIKGWVVLDSNLTILDINSSDLFISEKIFEIENDGFILLQASKVTWQSNENISVEHRIAEVSELASKQFVEEYVEEAIETIPIDNIEVCVPDVIDAIVGDTLQLFYRGMFKCVNYRDYDINITCDIGKQLPRYYELQATLNNVGEHNLSVVIKDNNNHVLGSKNAKIVVSNASQPSNQLNVLCVGASALEGGQIVSEFKRRITMSGGIPAGLNLSNISFVGRRIKEYNGIQVNLEATGGYSWDSYNNAVVPRVRFTVVNGTNININIDDVYSKDGYTFTVKELNPTSNYFSCQINDPTANIFWEAGTLTKVSGQGDSEVAFTTGRSTGNPFVNPTTNLVDIAWYANEYCNNKIDVVYTMLFYNSATSYMTDFQSMLAGMQTFINNFRAVFPNIKFCISAIYTPDTNGGLGYNYGARGGLSYEYGLRTSTLLFCNALQKYINDNNMEDYVYIWNCLNEFDSDNNTQLIEKDVNTRNTRKELFGINGVHPAESGYFQCADAAYRLFIAKFCN